MNITVHYFYIDFFRILHDNTQATPFFIHVDPYFTFLGVGHQGDARCPLPPIYNVGLIEQRILNYALCTTYVNDNSTLGSCI